MAYKAKVINVMIATPSDVATERNLARDAVYEWSAIHGEDKNLVLIPVGWDSHASPEMGDRPQAIINRQLLKNCDLLVAVFWTRLGHPTGEFASGTVEEIEEHLKAGKPAMIYFSSVPAIPGDLEQKQLKALLKFKEECKQRGLITEYNSLPDFKDKLARHLAQTVLRHFSKKNGPPGANDRVVPRRTKLPELSNPGRILLRDAALDTNGRIYRFRTMQGLEIRVNGFNRVDGLDPWSEACWEKAIRELHDAGLIEDRGSKREVFSVTNEGYRVAAFLRPEPLAMTEALA